jgi:hypothetical protein
LRKEATIPVKHKVSSPSVYEDPSIYGKELLRLREELRANRGKLSCMYCGKTVKVNLVDIEKTIRARRSVEQRSSRVFMMWDADLDEGGICKKCEGIVCASCSKASRLSYSTRPCRVCNNLLEGIDHITD